MEAGKLSKRVTIQRKSNPPDSEGYAIEVWEDLQTIWASIKTTGSREFYAAQKLNTETTAVFEIRFTRSITVRDRIKYGSRYFEMLGINDVDGKGITLLISAKEVVASG